MDGDTMISEFYFEYKLIAHLFSSRQNRLKLILSCNNLRRDLFHLLTATDMAIMVGAFMDGQPQSIWTSQVTVTMTSRLITKTNFPFHIPLRSVLTTSLRDLDFTMSDLQSHQVIRHFLESTRVRPTSCWMMDAFNCHPFPSLWSDEKWVFSEAECGSSECIYCKTSFVCCKLSQCQAQRV